MKKNPTKYFAHTRPSLDETTWESLEVHLHKTAAIAESFTRAFAPEGWGKLLGLWHDLGKYQDAFQRYLRASADNNCTIASELRTRGRGLKHGLE